MKKILVILFLVTALGSFAQTETIINDPNVETRTINSSFSAISVSDGILLYLTQGDDELVAISASDPKYLEHFKTEVENGVLKIYYDNNGLSWTGFEKRKLKAYVSFKTLGKLTASAGSSVILKSVFLENDVRFLFTSGANFKGEVDIHELTVEVNSGAEMEMTGKTETIKVDASSGALFKGYELVTNYCNAKATSGGGVRVSVNKELSVKANSGGGVIYKGNGVIKDMNVNSGGMVKKG